MESCAGAGAASSSSSSSSSSSAQSHHAVVFAWPGQGHLNPLLRFSELLLSHGFHITFAHNEHNLQRIQRISSRKSIPSSSVASRQSRFRLVGIPDGLPPEHPRDVLSLIQATDGPEQAMVIAFEELVGRLVAGGSSGMNGERAPGDDEPPPPSLIVSDFFMTFTQDVANKFNLPRIAVYVQSASSFLCHLAVVQGFKPSPGDNVIDSLPGIPPTLKPEEMISFLQCYDPEDSIYQYMLRSFKRLDEPEWVLINTFEQLEHQALEAIRKHRQVECIGPLVPSVADDHMKGSLRKEEEECTSWLDKQPCGSVLFLSFGSLATLTGRQAEELVMGMEGGRQPWMWVVREGMLAREEAQASEEGEQGMGGAEEEKQGMDGPEEGKQEMPYTLEGLKQRVMQGRACMVPWSNQWKVMCHPAVGGFLTHCGWNSVLEAIASGVPMLGLPFFADQMLNCRCVQDGWKVGFSLLGSGSCSLQPGQLVSRSQVAMAVRALFSDQLPPTTVRANCHRLKEAALQALQNDRRQLLLQSILSSLYGQPSKQSNGRNGTWIAGHL